MLFQLIEDVTDRGFQVHVYGIIDFLIPLQMVTWNDNSVSTDSTFEYT